MLPLITFAIPRWTAILPLLFLEIDCNMTSILQRLISQENRFGAMRT